MNISLIWNKAIACLVAAVLAVAGLVAFPAVPQDAFADEAELSALQTQIEQTAKDYDDATAKVAEMQVLVEENQARIDDINNRIPAQEQRSSNSLKTLYVVQQEGYGLLDIVLQAENLNDFIVKLEYLNTIQNHNMSELQKLADMKSELSATQAGLDAAKAEADSEADRAATALADAKQARQEAQERAEAEAAAQAAAAAAELAAAAEATATEEVTPEVATTTVASVDWTSDQQAFIEQWTPRINNYLAGSPLAGKGTQFATAAWAYGVDPRWSPAISCIESSKGLYNAGNCNAWGWMAVGGGWRSFGGWDEAIDAHVSYLARVYGPTCTLAAAAKYCPPGGDWYSKVISQMNKI